MEMLDGDRNHALTLRRLGAGGFQRSFGNIDPASSRSLVLHDAGGVFLPGLYARVQPFVRFGALKTVLEGPVLPGNFIALGRPARLEQPPARLEQPERGLHVGCAVPSQRGEAQENEIEAPVPEGHTCRGRWLGRS